MSSITNILYYAVSFILWCWHKVFGLILGPSNFVGWALSIILLVFTLRLVLLKPAIHQIRSMRKMQAFAPEMKKIQKKYANDRQRQAQEMQKLQREHGVNPLGGCLPMLLQIPVFIGLNHVLRSFREGTDQVYFFHGADVQSYLNAKLFGAHLGDAVLGIGSLGGTPGWHWEVAPVAIPLMIAAAVATHFTARLSVQRQLSMGTPGTSQTAMMNKLTLYIFPLGVLVFGGGFPVGLLLYWLSNNGWTLGQQHFVFKKMDLEDQQKKEQAVEARNALAPKVGQKPVAPKVGQKPVAGKKRPANQAKADETITPVEDAVPADYAEPVEDAQPPQNTKANQSRNGRATQRRQPARDPRRAVKPTVPNPNPPARGNGASGSASKKDGTPANGKASTEIPGLISDRSRRKKQDRKRG